MTATDDLRAWLHTLGRHGLEDLLALRSDVLRGAPVRDVADLADRLLHPASVAQALATMPTPIVQVLETLASCGPKGGARRAADLLESSPPTPHGPNHLEDVLASVTTLLRSGLVWPAPEAWGRGLPGAEREPAAAPHVDADTPLVVNPGLLAITPDPLGLGRPVGSIVRDITGTPLKRVLTRWGAPVPTRKDELVAAIEETLSDPGRVRGILAAAPPEVARVLLDGAQVKAGRLRGPAGGEASTHDDGLAGFAGRFDPADYRIQQAAVTWAGDHGLAYSRYGVTSYGAYGVEIPSEVTIALLGTDVRLPFDPTPPLVAKAPVTTAQIHRAASSALTETLALTMAVLEVADKQPLVELKSGGVGAREIARLAKRLGAQPADVRFALELAGARRLLQPVGGGCIGTSPRFARWRRLEPAERAAGLLRTWLELDFVPSLERDSDGRTPPALVGGEGTGSAALVRAVLLLQVRDLADEGIASTEALAELVAWRLPYAGGPAVLEETAASWAEAGRLGIAGVGALSEAGRALLDGEDENVLVPRLSPMLPATQTSALFGSDLTVVVPGSPAPAVVDLLDVVAVREGRGSAATWRFTPDSVRHALDEGHRAEDLLVRLRGLSARALPQGIDYLIRDVARRHGHVGVRAAGAVVLGEDTALLAEIVAHRGLRAMAFRQVAPTVLVADAGPDQVLSALRKAGFLPVPLDADGGRVVAVSPRSADAGHADQEAGVGSTQAGVGSTEAGVWNTGSAADGDDETTALGDADLALRMWSAEFSTGGDESVAEAARRLTEGAPPANVDLPETLEGEIRRLARRLSDSEVRHLAHAVASGTAVQIRYRSASGGVTVRRVSDLAVHGPHLHGWCHLRQDQRYFTLGGILEVSAA